MDRSLADRQAFGVSVLPHAFYLRVGHPFMAKPTGYTKYDLNEDLGGWGGGPFTRQQWLTRAFFGGLSGLILAYSVEKYGSVGADNLLWLGLCSLLCAFIVLVAKGMKDSYDEELENESD
jgi:hypothetical protein